jgi:AcrR family transcriptional regulator
MVFVKMTETTARSLDSVKERRGGRSARVREAVLAATRQQLMDGGYANVAHLAVARQAKVDPATVYRRWPTRARLAIDAVIDIAADAVPVPDTGAVRTDLEQFHRAVTGVLADPRLLRLFQAVFAAAFEDDPELRDALSEFWRRRFDGATAMLHRAVQRGEIPPQRDPDRVIEQLVATAYFRALVTGNPVGDDFTRSSVELAMLLARASQDQL